MTCLLIASTTMEIEPFLAEYRQYPGLVPCELDILISGIGICSTSYRLQKQLGIRQPDIVIQAGVAGSYDRKAEPGQVVLVARDRIGDEGAVEKGQFQTLTDLGLTNASDFPYLRGWLKNPLQPKIKSVSTVSGITVNQVSSNRKMVAIYKEKYKASVETMEGAALHYTCLMENIPFLQLRAISNIAGERNKKKWKMKEAITALNFSLANLLEMIPTIIK